MSADNGIYILQSPKNDQYEFRVIHAQAIDNLEWEPDRDGFNTAELKRYFGEATVYDDEDEVWKVARRMSKDYVILEYGISKIVLPFEFPS